MVTIPAYSFASLITVYQRFVSPHKGFCCAHRALNDGLPCSQAIKRIVLRHGFLASWPHVRARFDACRAAYRVLMVQVEDAKEGKNTETEYGECPVFTKAYWKSKKSIQCCDVVAPCACLPY